MERGGQEMILGKTDLGYALIGAANSKAGESRLLWI